MARSRVAEIKREKRKTYFFKELVSLIQELGGREKKIADLFVSHIDISESGGICYVYFSSYKEPGEEIFNEALDLLKLYRGSLRKAFSDRVQVRYAPELIFVYDKAKEKERIINHLLDKVHEELTSQQPESPADKGDL